VSGFEMTREGIDAYRKTQLAPQCTVVNKTVYPDSSTANNVVAGKNAFFRVRVPADGCYNFKRSFLRFTVKATHRNPLATKRFVNGIWNTVDRVKITQGSSVIQDRTFTNDFMNNKLLYRTQPDVAEKQAVEYGIGTQSERDGWAAADGREYSFPVELGFLGQGPIPLGKILNRYDGLLVPIDIEFYLNRPELCMESNDGNGLGFEITNIRWDVEKLEGDKFEEQLVGFFRGSQTITYKEMERYQAMITGIQQTIPIAHRANHIDFMFMQMVNLNALQDPTGPPNRHWQFGRNFLLDWQMKDAPLKGANSIFPSEKVDTSGNASRAYWMLKNWTSSHRLDGSSQDACLIEQGTFLGEGDVTQTTGAFAMVADFRSSRPDQEDFNHIVNPQSSRNQSSDSKMTLRFSQTPPDGLALNAYIQYTCIARVSPTGMVELLDLDYRV
jgi:hypothetical protein